jgi:hypothetical protein
VPFPRLVLLLSGVGGAVIRVVAGRRTDLHPTSPPRDDRLESVVPVWSIELLIGDDAGSVFTDEEAANLARITMPISVAEH